MIQFYKIDMKKNTLYQMLLILLFATQFGFAQVDVVYNNLVWSDEFDGTGAINATKWHHQTQIPAGGSWYNGELQHYTNRQINSFLNNGSLNILT